MAPVINVTHYPILESLGSNLGAMMDIVLLSLLLAPLGAIIFIKLTDDKNERPIVNAALTSAFLHILSSTLVVFHYLITGPFDFSFSLFKWGHEEFEVSFFIDSISITFLLLTSFLSGTIFRFSQRYLHRETGFSRFFSTLLVLTTGMTLLSISGNLETFFMGWEIIGVSSFLLIGFYRDRKQPIKNALKAFTVYRLCDVGLLVGALLEHKLITHDSFETLQNIDMVRFSLQQSGGISAGALLGLSLLLLFAAAGKSAQFPFSFWLPRAMEGPTPSSAIFYGALSIHAGLLLLMRTHGLWGSSTIAPIFVGTIGLITAFLGNGIARVQPTIKGQIGYASLAQVGLMFLELALGLDELALFHFVGNACLRCYQLLVSPSIVVFLLRRQSTTHGYAQLQVDDWSLERLLPTRIRSTLYVLVTKEAFMEDFWTLAVWNPLKTLSRNLKNKFFIFTPAIATLCFTFSWISFSQASKALAFTTSFLGILWGIRSLSQSKFTQTLRTVVLAITFVLCGILLGAPEKATECIPFIAGFYACYFAMIYLLRFAPESHVHLPLFFLTLAMIGFPISPIFFGEDLILDVAISISHSFGTLFTLAFILSGIALMKSFTQTYIQTEKGPIT